MKHVKLLFIILSLSVFNVNAASVNFSSASQNININDVFEIDVVGNDFAVNVDGGGFNLGFDADVLNVLSVTINETVWDFGDFGISTGTIDNSAGTVNGVMVNALSNVTGDFIVATVQFQAIDSGISALSLAEFDLNPWGSNGIKINPDYTESSIEVTAVPLPVAVWLFGSGLIGLIGVARRKKS